jgi:pyridoxine 5-phosphate synthase
MKKRKLGVNIDHVATIRNARCEKWPDPLQAALIVEQSGGDSVTIHLREDRRHIKDLDLKIIKKKLKIPLNLEIAPTNEMLKIALKYKPDYVCIVPEKRQEITTEGGLNLNKKKIFIKNMIKKLKKKKIKVSLFIEPNILDVKISKSIDADSVELHTGKYCKAFNNKKNEAIEFSRIKKSADYAKKILLNVHAGHGLTYESTKKICKIKNISEYNIGHFIISDSIFIGLKNSIKKFKKIIS